VEEIAMARSSRPFVEGPPEPSAAPVALEPEPLQAPAPDAVPASADLVRRMLALYGRMGERR
jgi:hypothetical protein